MSSSPTLISDIADKDALAEAQRIASCYSGSQVKSAKALGHQGMFSRSILVALKNGEKFIVQFKDNDIDVTFVALARSMLGSLVPLVDVVRTSLSHFAYLQTYIDGSRLLEEDRRGKVSDEQNISLSLQLGALISKCTLPESSAAIVDSFIIPRLVYIRQRSDSLPDKLREFLERLLPLAPGLKDLPLCLTHIDLNSANVSMFLISQFFSLKGSSDSH